MNSLMKSIQQNINNSVSQFIDEICKKYENVDKDDLHSIWEGKESVKPSKVPEKVIAPSLPVQKKSSDSKKGGCPYEYTKGDKKGSKCGVVAKNGGEYCSTHKKFEGKVVKEKKVLPVPIKSDSNKIAHRHPTLGIFYHRESSLVFKSSKEFIVVGKLVDNKIVEISEDDDIELCKKYNFKYETNFDLKKLKDEKLEVKKVETKKNESEDDEEEQSKPKKIEVKKVESTSDEEELPKPLIRKVDTKKVEVKKVEPSEDDNEEELPKPLIRKVDTKKVEKGRVLSSEVEEEEEEKKPIKQVKNLSETEKQIKTFCLTANKTQSIINKSLGCEEEELSDSE